MKLLHEKEQNSPLWSHCLKEHNGHIQQFTMNVVRTFHRDSMMRQITEAIHIRKIPERKSMNAKEEWNTVYLPHGNNIKHIQDLYNLPDIFTNENISSTTVINKEFFAQTVRDNTNIIDRDDNWNLLLYKEAYHIKRLTPFLNNGLKASRELRLFS